MDFFTAEFLEFFSTPVKMCFLSSRLSTFLLHPGISEIFLNFSNFLKSSILSHLITRQENPILTCW